MNEQNTNQENELTDLEPQCKVRGGTGTTEKHNIGALRNFSGGTTVNSGASLQVQGSLTIADESLLLQR